MSRKTAREIGIQMLYQMDFHNTEISEQMDIFLGNVLEEKIHNDKPLKNFTDEDISYVREAVNQVIININNIDKKIEELAKDWSIERIAKVDLAILRFAIYEILYRTDIPKEVAINEAVEAAKKYSTEDSKSFINGILGKVVK